MPNLKIDLSLTNGSTVSGTSETYNLYKHRITINEITFILITKDSRAYTTVSALREVVNTKFNGIIPINKMSSLRGYGECIINFISLEENYIQFLLIGDSNINIRTEPFNYIPSISDKVGWY